MLLIICFHCASSFFFWAHYRSLIGIARSSSFVFYEPLIIRFYCALLIILFYYGLIIRLYCTLLIIYFIASIALSSFALFACYSSFAFIALSSSFYFNAPTFNFIFSYLFFLCTRCIRPRH